MNQLELGFTRIETSSTTKLWRKSTSKKMIRSSDAMDIILTIKKLTALETKHLGTTKEVLPTNQLLVRAKELANSYLEENSFESITRIVDATVSGYNSDFRTGLDKESELFAELFLTKGV